MKTIQQRESNRLYARRKDGVGVEEDESFFYGYKLPLRKYELGFGYKGVLIYSKSRDKVQCHICGAFFRFINAKHLALHEYTAKTYKQEVGLSPTTALCGEGVRNEMIERCVLTNEENIEKRKVAYEEKKHNPRNSQEHVSLEARNKAGTCPDQLLDKIKQLQIMDKEIPTVRKFKEAYGNRFLWSIIRTYGSWGKAMEMLGMKVTPPRYSAEELLEYIRIFRVNNGRLPRNSDLKRGFLPSRWAYRNRFGSLRNAIALL